MFSELSLAEKDSDLSFNPGLLALIGEINGFGVTVSDRDSEYVIRIFAKAPYIHEKEIAATIISLSESLSKNTINSQCCEYSFVEVRMNKICLLQEKLVLMIDFLDKLTELMAELEITGEKPVLPEKPVSEQAAPKTRRKLRNVRLGFDFGSIKGLFGALLAVFAMTFISTLVIKYNENESSSLAITLSWWTSAAIPTLLIFFDYRFLAKKLDAFGIIVCPVLSVLTAFLSAIFVGAKTTAVLTECTFAEGFGKLGEVIEMNTDFAHFISMYLVEGVIVAVAVSIAVCLWYFSKHPDEMFKTEKSIEKDKNDNKK